MATPTDRHRQLAREAVAGDTFAGATIFERVAQLLAEQDVRRVPVEATGAAYQRGRRAMLAELRAWLDSPAAVGIDRAAAAAALHAWQVQQP